METAEKTFEVSYLCGAKKMIEGAKAAMSAFGKVESTQIKRGKTIVSECLVAGRKLMADPKK